MPIYLANAFSLNMLPDKFDGFIRVKRDIQLDTVKKLLQNNFINAIGHEGTAQLINSLFGLTLTANRVSVKLSRGDIVLIVQLKERLPEGKILNTDEVLDLYNQGKVQFDFVKVE